MELLKKKAKFQKNVTNFTNVNSPFASKIPIVTKDVSEYLPQCNASLFKNSKKHSRR